MAYRIGHSEHRQAEGQRHAEESDAHLREACRDHCAAAACEGEPEGSDGLGKALTKVHAAPRMKAVVSAASDAACVVHASSGRGSADDWSVFLHVNGGMRSTQPGWIMSGFFTGGEFAFTISVCLAPLPLP